MTDLTSLRHELVDRGASLLDDAATIAERSAHVAARLADERSATLRSSLSHSLPHSRPHPLRSIRRRRARARFAPPTWSLVLLVAMAVGGALYWRSTRRPPDTYRAVTDHLESTPSSDASVPGSTRVGAR